MTELDDIMAGVAQQVAAQQAAQQPQAMPPPQINMQPQPQQPQQPQPSGGLNSQGSVDPYSYMSNPVSALGLGLLSSTNLPDAIKTMTGMYTKSYDAMNERKALQDLAPALGLPQSATMSPDVVKLMVNAGYIKPQTYYDANDDAITKNPLQATQQPPGAYTPTDVSQGQDALDLQQKQVEATLGLKAATQALAARKQDLAETKHDEGPDLTTWNALSKSVTPQAVELYTLSNKLDNLAANIKDAGMSPFASNAADIQTQISKFTNLPVSEQAEKARQIGIETNDLVAQLAKAQASGARIGVGLMKFIATTKPGVDQPLATNLAAISRIKQELQPKFELAHTILTPGGSLSDKIDAARQSLEDNTNVDQPIANPLAAKSITNPTLRLPSGRIVDPTQYNPNALQ